MVMDVQILTMVTIKPSEPTPPHLKNYRLSLLDQFAPSLYVPLIFFYPNKDKTTVITTGARILTKLKESLSRALTIYYPLAGRLKDCVSVDCNDEGVEFIEARATGCTMSEFLKRPDIGALSSFLPCDTDVLLENDCYGINNIGLAKVKSTVFNDGDEFGGIVIGFCMFHRIGDASTAAAFLNCWAKICKGSQEKIELVPNFTFGSGAFPGRETLTSDFFTTVDNFFFPQSGSTSHLGTRRYVFDPAAITKLKNKIAGARSEKKVPNPTRVEALTAFVVKHMNIAAAAAAKSPDEDSPVTTTTTTTTLMITHAVNLRWLRRTEQQQPPAHNYCFIFGNFVWLAVAFYECSISSISTVDEQKMINNTCVELVETVREALISLKNESLGVSEFLMGADYDDTFTSLVELMRSICANDKIKTYRFSSWCNIGFYDVNFGWGNPIWVACTMGNIMTTHRCKLGFVFIESAHDNGGIELWVLADEQEISILEKDQEFLSYVTPNPGICLD